MAFCEICFDFLYILTARLLILSLIQKFKCSRLEKLFSTKHPRKNAFLSISKSRVGL